MVDRDRVNEAIGILNNILTRSNVITTMSEISNRNQQPSGSAVDGEMQRLFRPGTSGVSGQSRSSQANGNQANQPRFQTQQYFDVDAAYISRQQVAFSVCEQFNHRSQTWLFPVCMSSRPV